MSTPPAQTRFGFGENWRRFNASLNSPQRRAAMDSLRSWLGPIQGFSFLDVGAGSGLFAAAAEELGASVTAFDFDPATPAIVKGDVLDREYMASLGPFDVVYAWGVLHHTGSMWEALDITCEAVASNGRLFVSIYNDQGRRSDTWRAVKHMYSAVPRHLRPVYVAGVIAPFELRAFVKCALLRQNYFARWRHSGARGMTKWRDMVDWVGGYPFEVAKPEEVFDFCSARGFVLERLSTVGGSPGCNQFLFRRT
jgi:2-polyprenyl-6-hydroxyphenyl methylase/3-demethylubiquinone-9 3-methyltransferase